MGFFDTWPDRPADFGKWTNGNWPQKKFGYWSPTTSLDLGQPGIGVPGFSVNVDIRSLVRLVDKVTYQFRGGAFNRAIARANEEAAVKIKEGMAAALDAEVASNPIQRPQRPGKRLRNSLLHYNNHEVHVGGFTVGRPTWLDRSPAEEYWRQIEYGNVAREVNVLFTNDGSKWVGPWSPGGGKNKQPPEGYPHMRVNQKAAGGVPVSLGPFPAYEYTKGGARVARAMDWRALYRRHLAAEGISTSGVFKRTAITVNIDPL